MLNIRAYPSIRLGYTFRDDLFVALLVASVSTIFALVADGVEQELAAERAQDDLVELALDELVPVHLVHLALALAHGALAPEAGVDGPLAHVLLDCCGTRSD